MAAISAPSSTRRAGLRELGLALVSIATVLVAGEMVRRAVAHRFEASDPRLALAWEPSDAAARENLANQTLSHALASKAVATRAAALRETERAARRALSDGPLHWAALRDLGIAADTAGDKAAARSVMIRASLRGHRDIPTQGWWLQQALTAGDAVGAVPRIDALLRSQPDLEPRLLPIVAALTGVPAARAALAATLAENPPWRDAVLPDLATKGPDLAAVEALFFDLRARGSSPDDAAFGALLFRLAAVGRYADARAMWVKLASPRQAALAVTPYDGDFRKAPGPEPFNWRIHALEGGDARMELVPGVGSALTVSYPASAKPTIAEQLLTLSPGAYRLSGKWRVTGAARGAAVAWTVNCAADGAPLGGWRHGLDSQIAWTSFDAAIVVPPGCAAQWLRLSGQAGDGFEDVGAAFTALSIAPPAALAVAPLASR